MYGKGVLRRGVALLSGRYCTVISNSSSTEVKPSRVMLAPTWYLMLPENPPTTAMLYVAG
jgi:hypothetical protein